MLNLQAPAILLNAMANPGRLTILRMLLDKELSVNEICAAVGLEQSAVSQHLRLLRNAKLVSTRRDAQRVFYRCESEAVGKMMATLDQLFPRNGVLPDRNTKYP